MDPKFPLNLLKKSGEKYFQALIEYYETQPEYDYEECVEASIEYFDGDDLAGQKFVDKYALRKPNGKFLERTPEDMHHRLAWEFYRVEKRKFKNPYSYEEIFNLMDRFTYIVPQGSPMYGIGNPYQYITLSNCFVVDSPLDSISGILKTDQELAQIFKRRGGCGTSIETLRPAGAPTQNAARSSTGKLAFAERFSNTTREIGQNGRRGALMETTSVHHPDIMEFITVKNDLTRLTGANISTKLTDEFLTAVDKGTNYEVRFPVDSPTPIISKELDAQEVWDAICYNAWSMAEPGLLFWDNILRDSPADCYYMYGYRTISTNPCSELPLSAYDSCRLLLQNLYSYVVNPFTTDAYFDYSLYAQHAKIAQRFMDNMVDMELEMVRRILDKIDRDQEPNSVKTVERDLWCKIYDACKNGRRTGTGITALGDAIAACGIKYDSDDGIEMTSKIYKTLKLSAYRSSVDMAKELGSFPVWNYKLEKNNQFLLRIKDEDPQLYKDMKKYGRRNISLLTTAPTGTVSMMTQTSGGIEPEFSIEPYTRRVKGNPSDDNFRTDFVDDKGDHWMEFEVIKPKLKEWMKITGETDYKKSPWHGSCAPDLDWTKRVQIQAAAQKHVDHSISSTVNLPEDATVDDVKAIYMEAWKSGCKGITVYREGSRSGVLIRKETEKKQEIMLHDAPKRPKKLEAHVYHTKFKGDPYFVIVGMLNGLPYEIFAGRNGFIDGKSKECTVEKVKRGHYRAYMDNGDVVENLSDHITDEEASITRLLSLSLRHGVDVKYAVLSLQKVPGDMMGFGKVLSRILKKYIDDGTSVSGIGDNDGTYVFKEGCVVRLEDGWSACG